MTWAWNDTIDNTTDIFSAAFLSQFLNAIHERIKATGIVTYPPALGSPPVVNTATGTATQPAKSLPYGAAFDVFGAGFLDVTIQACQAAIDELVPCFRNAAIPIDGEVAGTIPLPIVFTHASLSTVLGLSAYTSGAGLGWRRKRPREVTATNIQGKLYDGYWVYRPGFLDWAYADINLTPIGGRARWLRGNTATSSGTPAVGGDEGIWEHQGAGVWLKVSDTNPFAIPDMLVSEGGSGSGSFVQYATLTYGDYVGAWLFQDMMAALNHLLDVVPGAYSPRDPSWPSTPLALYHGAGAPGFLTLFAQSGWQVDVPTAESVADGIYAGGTPTTGSTGFSETAELGTGAGYFAEVRSGTCYVAAPTVWKGLAHTTTFHVLPDVVGSAYYNRLGRTAGQWATWGSTPVAAATDTTGEELSPALNTGVKVPWPVTLIEQGWRLRGYIAHVSYTFTQRP